MAAKKNVKYEYLIVDNGNSDDPSDWESHFCETDDDVIEKLEEILNEIDCNTDDGEDVVETFFKCVRVYYIGDADVSVDVTQSKKFVVEFA
jgi:hypothetical protein